MKKNPFFEIKKRMKKNDFLEMKRIVPLDLLISAGTNTILTLIPADLEEMFGPEVRIVWVNRPSVLVMEPCGPEPVVEPTVLDLQERRIIELPLNQFAIRVPASPHSPEDGMEHLREWARNNRIKIMWVREARLEVSEEGRMWTLYLYGAFR